MFTTRYKALVFSFATVLSMQCREPVNLMKRAEPAENKERDAIKDTNSPAIKEGKPAEREWDKPAVQASDTLLPKRA